jgi:hypothetical protein
MTQIMYFPWLVFSGNINTRRIEQKFVLYCLAVNYELQFTIKKEQVHKIFRTISCDIYEILLVLYSYSDITVRETSDKRLTYISGV